MSTSEKLVFENDEGVELAGRMENPIGKPCAFAIFAHCFTCSKDVAAATRISRAMAARGIAVLRFDFTGLGNSDGDFANSNFSSNIADLSAAARFLDKTGRSPKLLVGHSLGGAAVLHAAADIPSVRAVATIGAPYEPGHVIKNFSCDLETINREGEADVNLAGRKFKIKKQFVDDLESFSSQKRIHHLERALLVFHAPDDDVVGIDNARHIYEAARHPKSFVSLDGADHLLSKRRDSQFVADLLAVWAARHAFDDVGDSRPTVEDGMVVVRERWKSFSQLVYTKNHTLQADEPKKIGGHDLGPNPYEYLSAALGACTSMTIRMYANRKQWPIEEINVSLSNERVHAKDCEDCESSEGIVHVFRKKIEISGSLTDEQLARVLEIADRCPVHRTLMGQMEIKTEIVRKQ